MVKRVAVATALAAMLGLAAPIVSAQDAPSQPPTTQSDAGPRVKPGKAKRIARVRKAKTGTRAQLRAKARALRAHVRALRQHGRRPTKAQRQGLRKDLQELKRQIAAGRHGK